MAAFAGRAGMNRSIRSSPVLRRHLRPVSHPALPAGCVWSSAPAPWRRPPPHPLPFRQSFLRVRGRKPARDSARETHWRASPRSPLQASCSHSPVHSQSPGKASFRDRRRNSPKTFRAPCCYLILRPPGSPVWIQPRFLHPHLRRSAGPHPIRRRPRGWPGLLPAKQAARTRRE